MEDETPKLPTKLLWQSKAFWSGIVTILIGLLQAFGVATSVTEYLTINRDVLVGMVLAVVGAVGVYGTVKRSTVLIVKKNEEEGGGI